MPKFDPETAHWFHSYKKGDKPYGCWYSRRGITLFCTIADEHYRVNEILSGKGRVWWKAINPRRRLRPVRLTLSVWTENNKITWKDRKPDSDGKIVIIKIVPGTSKFDSYSKVTEWDEMFQVTGSGIERIISQDQINNLNIAYSTFFCKGDK